MQKVKFDFEATKERIYAPNSNVPIGAPVDRNGNIANDGNAYGIVLCRRNENNKYWVKQNLVVMVAGYCDIIDAQEIWGVEYSAEAIAAMSDITFCDNHELPTGGGGTSDHRQLSNRDAANQHPISAIDGLQSALDGKQPIGDYATTQDVSDLADIVDTKADASDIPSLDGYATETYVNNHHDDTKQDVISDLSTIRSGASKGSTAYQKPSSGIPASDLAGGVIPSVPTALSQLSGDSTHRVVTDAEKSTWNAKQGAISDLAAIRSGAALGATAVQPETGKGLFSGNYNDLINKPTIPTVPTNVSAFTNDAGYLTSHQSLAAYRTSSAQDIIDATKQGKITASGILKGNGSGGVSAAVAGTDYQTPITFTSTPDEHIYKINGKDISAKYDSSDNQIDVTYATKTELGGKYTKPSGGIPKTDLASAVQTSLSKADTALQQHQDISGKQDVISDLATIRSNASAGASKISCTDAQVGSYGYIKLSDLPIYNGGVS